MRQSRGRATVSTVQPEDCACFSNVTVTAIQCDRLSVSWIEAIDLVATMVAQLNVVARVKL